MLAGVDLRAAGGCPISSSPTARSSPSTIASQSRRRWRSGATGSSPSAPIRRSSGSPGRTPGGSICADGRSSRASSTTTRTTWKKARCGSSSCGWTASTRAGRRSRWSGRRRNALPPGEWVFTLGGWSPDQFTDDKQAVHARRTRPGRAEHPVLLQFTRAETYLNSAALKAIGARRPDAIRRRRGSSATPPGGRPASSTPPARTAVRSKIPEATRRRAREPATWR